MHIFIDESGIFSASSDQKTWSTVGAVTVPDRSMKAVSDALRSLKLSLGAALGSEIKQERPDCQSEPYQIFLKALDDAGCTLHVLSTRGTAVEALGLEKHRKGTIDGVRNYASKIPEAAPHAEEVVALIESLKPQEYNQCILQVQIICEMLPKIISYYADFMPEEIGRFKWVIDRKGEKENRYERTFKSLYVGLVGVRARKQTAAILAGRNYSAFYRRFSPEEDVSELLIKSKEMYGVDHTHLKDAIVPVDFGDILEGEFSLEDSKENDGIQVADLLISSVNRCLKRNYTDNEKMAKALGSLMINAPRIDERCIMVLGHSGTRPLANAPAKLVNIMDAASKKLYGSMFRQNYSRNAPRL
ncbi:MULTISPECIES: DUF3800 domain-containing protein [unclassified Pseudomonas]|uniref:DUF3800 domain-containing protein n=1 Tax=unclassified Pseudomonas TaxID=196821 RepID=UPI001F58F223|nr:MULTISPECIES: DUF3800 domain-containing protein [unclassified Pseudomonas]